MGLSLRNAGSKDETSGCLSISRGFLVSSGRSLRSADHVCTEECVVVRV